MESQKKAYKALFAVILAVLAVALLVAALRVTFFGGRQQKFCFDFSHDMQFGDGQKIAHPVNQGTLMPNGATYFIPEVPALQEALRRQGLYIDPFENSGGKVYASAFFGPSTRAAVMAFQKKYGIEQSGQVTNQTIDKLSVLYKCPPTVSSATSTAVTIGTTTPLK